VTSTTEARSPWDAAKETRDWLRTAVEANRPLWLSLPPDQLLALLDRLDELEARLASDSTPTEDVTDD
jgi:hypothetical protein